MDEILELEKQGWQALSTSGDAGMEAGLSPTFAGLNWWLMPG
jgi:hypothetical protein